MKKGNLLHPDQRGVLLIEVSDQRGVLIRGCPAN